MTSARRRRGGSGPGAAEAALAAGLAAERRSSALTLLHETGRRLTSLLDIDLLLPEMVEQLRAVLGVEIVSVMMLDEAEGVLRVRASAGLPADVVGGARVPLGEGISGQVAARGEPVLIRDMRQEPAFGRSPYHAQYTTESFLCVPLRLGPRVIGVINVNNKLDGESLDENDLRLVTTFSAQAVLALENSRLYGGLQAEVERMTAELSASNAELRRLTEFSESILENMGSGLVTVDLQACITKLNAAAVSLFAVPPEQLAGLPLAELFGAEAAIEMLAAQADGPHGRREVTVTTRAGRELLLGYSASPLLDAAGQPAGTIVIFRDLAQLKRMERELVRMDRLASLGVLGAGIAHEIRNPLAAIRFNLDFLREAGGAAPELDVILKNVTRLDDLVKKLLRFARPQAPAFRSQSVGARIEAVVALVAKQAAASGVRIALELDPAADLAWLDSQQAEQVVLNVALNAIQAMPSGGTLTISTRPGPATGRGRFVEIVVCDEGPGLPPGGVEQLFDPFFTTREEGTGLGLAVAHRIMEDHGGYIEAAAARPLPEGAALDLRPGATFVLGFPVDESARRAATGRDH